MSESSQTLATKASDTDARWIEGSVDTAVGEVPRVGTALRLADRVGAWKARWDIGRMDYRVEPGLYAIGQPTTGSPVLVSANYKMSFDRLRSQLAGRDVWILVLDTNGINVWCAAGKGTFGTDELVGRAEAVGLGRVVSHRTLVVPQLGAPGVSAHEVKQRSGFRVAYGPIRADDLPAFLDAGMKATPDMRRVHFPLGDRAALVPVEVVGSLKYLAIAAAVLVALSGLGPHVYSVSRATSVGLRSVGLLVGAYVAGTVLTPLLLPWLPGRHFALKGAWAGSIFAAGVGCYAWNHPGLIETWPSAVGWSLITIAVASFLGMNFTGASTYTSLSGVRREMLYAVPVQVVCVAIGLAAWLVGLFV